MITLSDELAGVMRTAEALRQTFWQLCFSLKASLCIISLALCGLKHDVRANRIMLVYSCMLCVVTAKHLHTLIYTLNDVNI